MTCKSKDVCLSIMQTEIFQCKKNLLVVPDKKPSLDQSQQDSSSGHHERPSNSC